MTKKVVALIILAGTLGIGSTAMANDPPACPRGYHAVYHPPSNGGHGYYTCAKD